jgi:hypothetical protein
MSRTRKAFGSTCCTWPALTIANSRSRTVTSANLKTNDLVANVGVITTSSETLQEPIKTIAHELTQSRVIAGSGSHAWFVSSGVSRRFARAWAPSPANPAGRGMPKVYRRAAWAAMKFRRGPQAFCAQRHSPSPAGDSHHAKSMSRTSISFPLAPCGPIPPPAN